MSKQQNDNIGYVACAECGQLSALRLTRTGKYYYDCLDCGRITPNLDDGQGRIMDRAVLFGPEGPPPETPKWIAEQWRWGRARRDLSGREPSGPVPSTGKPAGAAKPPAVTIAAPVNVNEPLPAESPEPSPGPVRKKTGSGFAFLEDE